MSVRGEFILVADGRLVGDQRRLQRHEIVLGRIARRFARQPDFEEQPRTLEIAMPFLGRKHLAHGRRHAGEDMARGRHQHACPRTVREFNQPGLLQGDQRLANSRPADPECGLQIALWRQLIAGPHLAGKDLRLEMRGDVLEEFSTLDNNGLHHRPFIPSYLTTMQQLARI